MTDSKLPRWLKPFLTPKEGDASVFGIVLYTAEHAQVRKVIEDKLYWEALDEASGPFWRVFAAVADRGRLDWSGGGGSTGGAGYMVQVWTEPATNKEFLGFFGIESTQVLPVVAVYVPKSDGTLWFLTRPIDNRTAEAALQSTRTILTVVRDALAKVDLKNMTNPDGLLNAVGLAFSSHETWVSVKKTVGVARFIGRLVRASPPTDE